MDGGEARRADELFTKGLGAATAFAQRWLADNPGSRALRRARDWRRFQRTRAGGRYFGSYESFARAQAALPLSPQRGSEPSRRAPPAPLHHQPESEDFAILYWLERTVAPGQRIFDWCGEVGSKYYFFKSIGALPSPVQWTVCDVGQVIDAGRQIAAEHQAEELSFTTEFSDAAGADALLVLNALQYVERPLWERLSELEQVPRFVIISAAPVAEAARYVTLEQRAGVFRPLLIEDQGALVQNMAELGYQLRHSWSVPGERCLIADRPERSVERRSFHFALDEARWREP